MMKRIPVKNLAHLKSLLKTGALYRVINHPYKPDLVGLVREVTTVQTNAIYSKVKNQPEHKYSTCNDGKGAWFPYCKASDYVFGDTVKVMSSKEPRNLLFEFEVLECVEGGAE